MAIRGNTFLDRVGISLALLVAVALRAAAGPSVPELVSPGAGRGIAVAEARCPTFSWAGVPGATGYELAVFRLSTDRVGDQPAGEPELVTRVALPRDAQTWTSPVGQCLERGERYAWSVAATTSSARRDDSLDWAPTFLFEVEAAPSADELEEAVATIERHLAAQQPRGQESARSLGSSEPRQRAARANVRDARQRVEPRDAAAGEHDRPLVAPTTSGRVATASTAPTLGTTSLQVSDAIHLSATSNLFKDNAAFLWDDAVAGNTALGRNALDSAGGSAEHNTAIGRQALSETTTGSHNTAVGDSALFSNTTGQRNTAMGTYALNVNLTGDDNTALGAKALQTNEEGIRNTAIGAYALRVNDANFNTAVGANALLANTSGARNTAIGESALRSNTTGNQNTASGDSAMRLNTEGYLNTAHGLYALGRNTEGNGNTAVGHLALSNNTTGTNNIAIGSFAGVNGEIGENNILIGHPGNAVVDETNTIRIGEDQSATYVAGIAFTPVTGAAVLVNSFGRLGVSTSSRAVKQDIEDLGPLADRLLELRPVAFRYREHAAADPETPREFGLIAEEVAEVFPELVVYDQNGEPQTVKYHLLSSLLLGELKKQSAVLQTQHGELEHQRELVSRQNEALERLAERLAALESHAATNGDAVRHGAGRR